MCVLLRLKDDSFFEYNCDTVRFFNNDLVIVIGVRELSYPISDIFAFTITKESLV